MENPLREPKTFRQMCEVVEQAEIIHQNDRPATAEEIYNYSPTGELWEIFFWYLEAMVVLGNVTDAQLEEHLEYLDKLNNEIS